MLGKLIKFSFQFINRFIPCYVIFEFDVIFNFEINIFLLLVGERNRLIKLNNVDDRFNSVLQRFLLLNILLILEIYVLLVIGFINPVSILLLSFCLIFHIFFRVILITHRLINFILVQEILSCLL